MEKGVSSGPRIDNKESKMFPDGVCTLVVACKMYCLITPFKSARIGSNRDRAIPNCMCGNYQSIESKE